MDKLLLMQMLAIVREKAEAAHFEIVTRTQLVAQLGKQQQDAATAKAQLNAWKMAEQKYLKELDWILDQIEKLE